MSGTSQATAACQDGDSARLTETQVDHEVGCPHEQSLLAPLVDARVLRRLCSCTAATWVLATNANTWRQHCTQTSQQRCETVCHIEIWTCGQSDSPTKKRNAIRQLMRICGVLPDEQAMRIMNTKMMAWGQRRALAEMRTVVKNMPSLRPSLSEIHPKLICPITTAVSL